MGTFGTHPRAVGPGPWAQYTRHRKTDYSTKTDIKTNNQYWWGSAPTDPHSRSASGLQVMLVGRSRGLRDYIGNSIINYN